MKILLLLGMVTTILCMPGGKTIQLKPENDKELVDALSFAMEKLNGLLTSDPKMMTVKIVKAETQVVAGINYFLTIKVHYGTEVKECRVTVYSKPWMKFKALSSQNCIDMSASNDMVLGGVVPINADKEAKTAISFGIEEFNARSNNVFRTVPLQITNLTKQLVSGNLYKFDAILKTSTCQNNPDNKNKGLDKCPASSTNNLPSKCSFEVVHQSWLDTPWSLTNYHCEQDRALKVSLLGGDRHDLCHFTHFQNYKSSFKKSYKTTEEEVKRFKIFCDNMKKARKMQDIEKGSAKYGPTIFADMTEEEFSQRLNHKPWNVDIRPGNMLDADIPEGNVPTSFDWRDHGAVTPVKNQGSCGSCWAFSTTGNIEGQWAIKMKKLISLSEQELVDCDKVDQGCNGGLPSQAYEAIIKLGGLETEKEYGYKGFDEKCFFNKSEAIVKISGSVKISSDETKMAAWLAQNGPISIGINAFAMQFYMGGIAHPWKMFCNPKKLDHGVLIVGYGIKNNEPYWIVKNSWGPRWGEKGYYLVYRGGGVCGLNTMCTSATVN